MAVQRRRLHQHRLRLHRVSRVAAVRRQRQRAGVRAGRAVCVPGAVSPVRELYQPVIILATVLPEIQ